MATNTGGGTTTSLNNTPQAVDDFYTANEDEVLYFSVMANDLGGNAKTLWSIDNTSDDGSGDLVAKDVAGVCEYSELGAKISLTSDGRIRYDTTLLDSLAAGQTVIDQFTYAIRMSNGTLSWATVTVTLTGTNDGPIANVDTGSAGENEDKAFNVLANDTDVDNGAVLTLASINGVTVDGVAANAGEQAAFTIVGNQIQFAPGTAFDHLAAGDSATVVVSYTVSDEHGATSTSTLTLTVTGTNDGPVANADSDTTSENAVLNVDVLANDTDVDDGHVLTVTAASAPAGQGSASVVGNQVQFDPGTDFDHLNVGDSEIVTVSYTIEDEHGASSSSTVEITVTGTNDGPVANADSDTTSENAILNVDVLANDTDADDGAVLTVTAASAPARQGSASVVGNQVQFDPGTDFDHLNVGDSEIVTVSYTIEDEHGASSSSTVEITVTGTNDGPVADDDSGSGNEDTTISGSVAANDDDADDGAVLGFAVNGSPPAGFSMDGDGNWSLDASNLAYQHIAAGESQEVIVNYTVTDEHGASDTATLTITVHGVNDDPALTGAQAVLPGGTEDQSYIVSAASLLTGFTDVDDGTVLAVSLLSSNHGSVIDNGDGTYTITPEADYNGTVTLSYNVVDGDGGSVPATLTFNLAAVNDPAVISGTTTGTVLEATPANAGTPTATGTLLAADVDNPPNTFIAQGSTATASGYGSFTMSAGGTWNYTLNNANLTVDALATGGFLIDTFQVQSADGTIQTITVTINGATDAFVVTPPPTENGADPNDFDNLTGGIVVTGNFTATNGNDTFTGDGGNQTLNGSGGNDTIYGAGGNDNINGNNDNDTLYGQAGSDSVDGNNGLDTLYGGSGSDTLTGGNDGDTMYGGSAGDIINGSNGNDIIIGGYGADTLTGGGNDDTFTYLSTLDTNDTILDFMASGNDQIDLSAIDAVSGGANDPFAWGGTTATANGLWFSYDAGTNTTTLYGDTDGNAATAEFMLTLQNYSGLNPFNNPLTPPPDITL